MTIVTKSAVAPTPRSSRAPVLVTLLVCAWLLRSTASGPLAIA